MTDIYQLKNFATFAECGTLSKAAEILNTSQPSLTRSMASLEYELGVSLFKRTKNKLTLNGNGKLALEYAKKILSQVEEMKDRVAENDKLNNAVLIGTVAPAPIWVLQEDGNEFGGRRIEYTIASEESLLEGIERGRYERIILPYPAEGGKFSCRKVCDESLFFSLPKSHKFAKRKSLCFSEMNGETFIVFSEIGFWDKIHRENLPDSKFLIQSDKFTLEELTQNSSLPHFVTDLSLKHFNRPVENKSVVPIADEAARAEFFLWERK